MTSPSQRTAPASSGAPIPFVEFVALIASLMALTALGIDSMLPALPAIGTSLGVTDASHRQWVITAFLIGFGVAQLVHGPLVDRYGRRRVLLWSFGAYVLANIACASAGSFEMLLIARVIGGAAIAATRVAVIALVRDCYQGRAMARVMSIAFMVFMIVPILAPTFGQAVLMFTQWRGIFWVVAAITLAVAAWLTVRMPETLAPADRRPIAVGQVLAGWRLAVTDRWSLGYTLAATAMSAGLYGYLNSIEPLVTDSFGRPRLIGIVFAASSVTMALCNLANSQLVMRLGTRRISHGAVVTMIAVSLVHWAVEASGHETLVLFVLFQAMTMGCLALANSNFSAMAMERMGHIAGVANSVQGFTTVTLGAMVGAVIGSAFDGSAGPMILGFLFASTTALIIILVTERGRLFHAVDGVGASASAAAAHA